MKISIGSDHAGYVVKQKIIEYLRNRDVIIIDKGTHSEESVDYPEFGHSVGKSVKSGESRRGIVVCGSGIGISIAANKISGIRAALCTSVEHALMSRKHNDSNVLALGARMTDFSLTKEIIDAWLLGEFEGGRHLKRINKIEEL